MSIISIVKSWMICNSHQLKGSFDGFRLVLIGDMHEQPMLHFKVKPFIVGAKDWSGEVSSKNVSYKSTEILCAV
jgi:vacuolar protein sorting-associated protein 13A/C